MWKITAKSANEAEILLYDEISEYDAEDWGFINAKGLINKIKALGNVKDITLRINSVGGDVFQCQSMYSYLRSHPAKITVRVDGLAASSASIVAMAGDKVIMSSNALMMIHNPAGGVYGEADDMRDCAEILDKIQGTFADVYVAKTGLEREKVIAMMDAETWLDAAEARELGFCDEVEENITVSAIAGKNGMIFRSGFGFSRIDGTMSAGMPKDIITKEENSEMEITNAAELENAYPELVKELRASAVQNERERLRVLDSLNAPGREEIILKAKYEAPRDARDIAIELLQADTAQARLRALQEDAGEVDGALKPERTTPNAKAEEEAAISAVVNELNRMRGYK